MGVSVEDISIYGRMKKFKDKLRDHKMVKWTINRSLNSESVIKGILSMGKLLNN